MKKFKAIIKPLTWEVGKDALARLGVEGMTVSEAKDFGGEVGKHPD